MPRGRPVGSKNKSTLQKEALFDVQPQVLSQNVVENPVIKPDKYKHCMLCDGPIYSGACSVQLTSFTGKAYWWRNVPDVVQMCPSCSKKFSDHVEHWLISNGLKERISI